MTNAVALPLRAGGAPSIFQSRNNLPDMNAAAQQGINASFAVIGFKGRNWRIKHAGEEELLMDARGVPMATLDVVIVGISQAVSKQWYGKAYSEGDDGAPDCFSTDGIAPDPTSPKIQGSLCATCPMNVYGSKMSDNGKKSKACQDARRLAVLPTGDLENAAYGGPMLLRLPPMSLSGLARYSHDLARFSAQPFMVRTELGFDYDVAYPLITFKAGGWLDDEQATAVAAALDNPLIGRILETGASAPAAAGPASPLATGGPAKGFGTPPAPAPAPAPAPRPAPAPAAAAAPVPLSDPMEAEMAAMEAKMAAYKASKATTVAPPVEVSNVTALPPPKKIGGFGAKKAAPEAHVEAAHVEVVAEAPTEHPVGVTPAPADLESAIDALLS